MASSDKASEASLRNHVVKSFRSQESKLAKNDLKDHIPLILEAAKSDRDLKKSKGKRGVGSILTAMKFGNNDGIVFASDTLIIQVDGKESFRPKFIVTSTERVLGGSGDTRVTDHIFELYERCAQDKPLESGAEYVKKEFKKLCKKLKEERFMGHEATECEFLLCGMDSIIGPQIFHISFENDETAGWGTFIVEEVDEVETIGSGAAYLNKNPSGYLDYVQKRYDTESTCKQRWNLAKDMIIKAMRGDSNCGGGGIDRVILETGKTVRHDPNILDSAMCKRIISLLLDV